LIFTLRGQHHVPAASLRLDLIVAYEYDSHQIAPKYETLSKQYTNVTFTKCDVDAAQDVAQKYSIAAMPSFVFLRNGQKVDMVKGADPRGLENAIKKHASGTSGSASAFSGSGHTLGSTSASTSTPKAPAVPAAPSAIAEKWGQIDPQVQLLILFVGLYVGYVVFY